MDSRISAPNSVGYVVSDFKGIASELTRLMGDLNRERSNLQSASGGQWLDGFTAADAQWQKVLDLTSGSTTVMATNADNFQVNMRDTDKRGEMLFRDA